MNKKQKMDLLIIFLVFGVLLFMGFTYRFMLSHGKECVQDPLAYFERLNEGAFCNCWKDGVPYRETNVISKPLA